MYHARDSRARRGNSNIYLGGATILAKNKYKYQTAVTAMAPARDNTKWIEIATTEGTWVIGAAYSRPGHIEEHIQMMEDLAEDISLIRQNEDVIGILLAGDLNCRLGKITGSTTTAQNEKESTPHATCYPTQEWPCASQKKDQKETHIHVKKAQAKGQ